MIEQHRCRLSPELFHECAVCHKHLRDGRYIADDFLAMNRDTIWLCSIECGEVAEALEALRA